jgi:nucleotide-binding universal stress UspA family protein
MASPEIFAEAARHEMKACQSYLANTVKELQGKGLKVDSACLEGVPARAIIKYAHDNAFDLIALATHGKGEVAWVMGSTAEKILSHATVPVLLIRVMVYKPPLLKEEFFLGA